MYKNMVVLFVFVFEIVWYMVVIRVFKLVVVWLFK